LAESEEKQDTLDKEYSLGQLVSKTRNDAMDDIKDELLQESQSTD
tara:strand:+ start:1858 stop:1992 length:135 start_codon:yes stop_codon:yes gene_type:complete